MKEKINKSYISENNIVCAMDNGIVYELGYKTGDAVSSEKKVLSVMNLDIIVVKANVAEEFIKDVKLGAKVEIIPVEIAIENKDSFLFPNFNVDVKIYME